MCEFKWKCLYIYIYCTFCGSHGFAAYFMSTCTEFKWNHHPINYKSSYHLTTLHQNCPGEDEIIISTSIGYRASNQHCWYDTKPKSKPKFGYCDNTTTWLENSSVWSQTNSQSPSVLRAGPQSESSGVPTVVRQVSQCCGILWQPCIIIATHNSC